MSERSWDLSVLVDGATTDKVKMLLDGLVDRANELNEKYTSKIASMSAMDIKEMLESLMSFRIDYFDFTNYGTLRFSADSTDKDTIQLNGWSRRTRSQIDQILKPIDLKLGKLLTDQPELIEAPAHHAGQHEHGTA